MGTKGFTCTYEDYGNLDDGNRQSYQVFLKAGHFYQIVGVCDNDCRDLDLKIYDQNGNLAAKDDSADDYPLVSCNVYITGWYIVKVKMYECGNNPCSYGIAVFGR